MVSPRKWGGGGNSMLEFLPYGDIAVHFGRYTVVLMRVTERSYLWLAQHYECYGFDFDS